MRHVKALFILFHAARLFAAHAHAADSAQIEVKLFGQDCTLKGPVSETALKAIHAVGPERNTSPDTAALAREQLDRIQKTKEAPESLDRYVERLAAHHQAIIAFFKGAEDAKKAGKIGPFSEAVRSHLLARRADAFLAKTTLLSLGPAAIDQTLAQFREAIEPHPEQEFHRAIDRMGVRYSCASEEHASSEDAEDLAE